MSDREISSSEPGEEDEINWDVVYDGGFCYNCQDIHVETYIELTSILEYLEQVKTRAEAAGEENMAQLVLAMQQVFLSQKPPFIPPDVMRKAGIQKDLWDRRN